MKQMKYFFQRLFRGWDDTMYWNFDYWHTQKIYKPFKAFVKWFKKNSAGYPANFKTEKEWHNVLDKILFSFEHLYKMEHDWGYTEKYYLKGKNIKEIEKKVQEGCELFGKYLQNMWD